MSLSGTCAFAICIDGMDNEDFVLYMRIIPSFPPHAINRASDDHMAEPIAVRPPLVLDDMAITCFCESLTSTSQIRTVESFPEVMKKDVSFGCHMHEVRLDVWPLVTRKSRRYGSPLQKIPKSSPSLLKSLAWLVVGATRIMPPVELNWIERMGFPDAGSHDQNGARSDDMP